jgi:hypothetical protein
MIIVWSRLAVGILSAVEREHHVEQKPAEERLKSMKVWLYAVAAILVGLVGGVGTAWNEVERMPKQFEPTNRTMAALEASRDESGRLGPKAEVVDGTTFDFGSGQRNGKGKHTFVIRNLGDQALTLSRGATSCKCAFSELKNDNVGPGESTDVTLEWHLTTEGEQFRQTADIHTNDPRQPTITLVAQGAVTDWVRIEPRELVLSNISVSEGTQAHFRCMDSRWSGWLWSITALPIPRLRITSSWSLPNTIIRKFR